MLRAWPLLAAILSVLAAPSWAEEPDSSPPANYVASVFPGPSAG